MQLPTESRLTGRAMSWAAETALLVGGALLVPASLLWLYFRPPRIPGIPAVPDNSIIGFNLGMLDPQLHILALELSKRMGPLYQYRLIGHRIVIVNDMNLVRQVFRDVHGKGKVIL